MFSCIRNTRITHVAEACLKPLCKSARFVSETIIYLFISTVRFVFGIKFVNSLLIILPEPFIKPALRSCGCKIGQKAVIQTPLIIMNAHSGNYSNLVIGNQCFVGKMVCLDLTELIEIGDNSAVSVGVTILTHEDPGGYNELRRYFPRKSGRVVIGSNAWIGTSSTLLCGITIGDHSIIGASSLVKDNIAPYSVAAGIPAKVIRTIGLSSK